MAGWAGNARGRSAPGTLRSRPLRPAGLRRSRPVPTTRGRPVRRADIRFANRDYPFTKRDHGSVLARQFCELRVTA